MNQLHTMAYVSPPDQDVLRIELARQKRRRNQILVAVVFASIVGMVLNLAMSGALLLGVQSALRNSPPSGVGAAESRLAPAVVPGTTGTYQFLNTVDGNPVAYSPCRVTEIVVNLNGAPTGSMAQVERAAAAVSDASGLTLRVTETVNEKFSPTRSPYLPDQYGQRWAPVLVSWEDETQFPDFEGDSVAFAGSIATHTANGNDVYVSGTVTLSDTEFGNNADSYQYSTLLHEFGHVVGLDHVDDANEIMHDYINGATEFGPGDRAGLAKVGQGTCDSTI